MLLPGEKMDVIVADSSTVTTIKQIIDDGKAKYPKSAAKIKFMVQRFEEDGFTSYWL